MLHYLSGSDVFRIRERERELDADFLARSPKAERSVFFLDGEENIANRIRELLSGGLFATPAIIHVRDINELPDEASEEMKIILEEARETADALVVVTDESGSKKKPALIKWLEKKAQWEKFPDFDPARPRELAEYGKKPLSNISERSSIEPQALMLLAERAKGKSGMLAQELRKLVAFKERGQITRSDVELLSQESVESNVFLALDALVSGKRGEAIALFRREEKLDVPIQKTLGLCAWQIRRLIAVRELSDGGMREVGAIARELKSSPYPIQKVLPKITRFPMDRLKQGLSLLAELDLGIRSGRMAPGVALDLFVWKF